MLAVPSAVLVRRQAVLDVGGFDPSLVNCGDWDLWGTRRAAPRRRRRGGLPGDELPHAAVEPEPQPRPRAAGRDHYAAPSIARAQPARARVRCGVRPNLRNGADPALLPARVVHFAAYAAGIALGAGEAGPAVELLDLETLRPYLTDASGGCDGDRGQPALRGVVRPL